MALTLRRRAGRSRRRSSKRPTTRREPKPRRAYAMVLMIIGSLVISFGGLIIRNIHKADTWQINFYRSFAFGTAISVMLIFCYGKSDLQQLKGTELYGVLAALLLAFALITFLQAIANTTLATTRFTLSSIPFIAAAMAWQFLGGRIGKSTILTMFVATVGISLMFIEGVVP